MLNVRKLRMLIVPVILCAVNASYAISSNASQTLQCTLGTYLDITPQTSGAVVTTTITPDTGNLTAALVSKFKINLNTDSQDLYLQGKTTGAAGDVNALFRQGSQTYVVFSNTASGKVPTAADGIGQARTTIHFSINKPVTEHNVGNVWNTMKYSIITPFKETLENMPKSKVFGGLQDDFFFQDAVKLPKGSVIVKYNPNVPSQRFLVSDAFDGIKLIETSEQNLNEVSNVVIKKMGYTSYDDALKHFLSASDKEMQILTSIPESQLKDQINTIVQNGGFAQAKEGLKENLKLTLDMFSDNNIPMAEQYIKNAKENFDKNIEMLNVMEKYAKKLEAFPNSWAKYCSSENFVNGQHTKTPWFKAEVSLNAIDMCKRANNNSWGKDLKQIIIKTLEDAQSTLPEGKSLGIDANKLIKIIKSSKTPNDALIQIEKELKIKAMPPKDLAELGEEIQGEDGVKYMLEYLGII